MDADLDGDGKVSIWERFCVVVLGAAVASFAGMQFL